MKHFKLNNMSVGGPKKTKGVIYRVTNYLPTSTSARSAMGRMLFQGLTILDDGTGASNRYLTF